MEEAKKMKCYKGLIYKQFVQVSGLCSPQFLSYRKIPKRGPGAYIFQRPYLGGLFLEGLIFKGAYIRRGLYMEGNWRFKINWAILIVGRKFAVFALFYFVFEGNF